MMTFEHRSIYTICTLHKRLGLQAGEASLCVECGEVWEKMDHYINPNPILGHSDGKAALSTALSSL